MEKSDKSVETSDHPIMPEYSTSKDNEDENSIVRLYQVLAGMLITYIWPIEPMDPYLLCYNSLIYVLLDPLFLYVPLINEDIKCVTVDNRLKIATLVLRSFSDLRYLVRVIAAIKKGRRESHFLKKIAMSIAVDTVCLLPIPQVVVLIFLPNMRGSSSLWIMKFLNSFIVLQYLARAYPLYLMYTNGNRSTRNNKNRNRFAIVLNLFAFFLASHVLGAFWYLFSIQREIDCWEYASRSEYGSTFSTSCDDRALNATRTHRLCPINPPDASVFDFGIFLYALQSGMQGSTNSPRKVVQGFSWGLRNLSSFASNLNISNYVWENMFVVVISISGLVLFIYLLGHVQTYMTREGGSIREKMEEIKPKMQHLLSDYGLPKEMELKVEQVIKAKLENVNDLVVENMFSILSNPSELDETDMNVAIEIKYNIFKDKLRKVDGLKDKGEEVWKKVSENLEPMIYSKGCYIIQEGEPLDMMFFVTGDSVLTYATNNGGSNASSGTSQLEKERDGLYGEELLAWAEAPSSKLSNLPVSGITVKCYNKPNKVVEIFALHATDLQRVVSTFPGQSNMDRTLTIAVDNGIVN